MGVNRPCLLSVTLPQQHFQSSFYLTVAHRASVSQGDCGHCRGDAVCHCTGGGLVLVRVTVDTARGCCVPLYWGRASVRQGDCGHCRGDAVCHCTGGGLVLVRVTVDTAEGMLCAIVLGEG